MLIGILFVQETMCRSYAEVSKLLGTEFLIIHRNAVKTMKGGRPSGGMLVLVHRSLVVDKEFYSQCIGVVKLNHLAFVHVHLPFYNKSDSQQLDNFLSEILTLKVY